MGYNHGAEEKKFERMWQKFRQEYQELGMSEDTIQKIHDFDRDVFLEERRYLEKYQRYPDGSVHDDRSDGRRITMISRFQEQFQITDVPYMSEDRHAWIKEADDENLSKESRKLSEEDIEILTLVYVDRCKQKEVAQQYGLSKDQISRRLKKLRKILKNS